MVSKRLGQFVIWPAYFNKSLTWSQGRRVVKNQSVDSPTVDQIVAACQGLKLPFSVEAEKIYPSKPWSNKGRILIDKKKSKLSKSETIKVIAKKLKKFKSQKVKK